MNFKDLAVSRKLAGVFGGVLVVTAALGLFSLSSLSSLNGKSREVRDNWLPAITNLGRFEYFITRSRVAQANFTMAETDAQRATAIDNIRTFSGQAEAAWTQYVSTVTSPEEKTLVARIVAERADYQPLQTKLEDTILAKARQIKLLRQGQ